MSARKQQSHRKNLPEEFSSCMQIVQSVQHELDRLKQSETSTQENEKLAIVLKESLAQLKLLTQNDYFHFMFIDNLIVKNFCLSFLLNIIEQHRKFEPGLSLKLETFRILGDLIEWDFDLNKNHFRNEPTNKIYTDYFIRILPELIDTLCLLNKQQQSATPFMNSIFSEEPKPNESLFSLNKLICFMFSSVPFQHLIDTEFLPNHFDLLFAQLLSPLLYAQLMYTISNNICGYTSTPGRTEFSTIDEKVKINIHERCSHQTLTQMERNVRNEGSRNLLKKALNNYCQFITSHKKRLETAFSNKGLGAMIRNGIVYNHEFDVDDEDLEEARNIVSWQEALYKIVINIVKILRLEFENNTNFVEIDLVIYFYELLLTNIDSLTSEDSINIANKLMPVLIKINEWRKRELKNDIVRFTIQQSDFLHYLSFKLTDKFMLVLGEEFCWTHWPSFEPIWLVAINDWYPMSFKIISTFCLNNKNSNSFESARKLANVIMKSWNTNSEMPKNGSNCFCGKQPKKRYDAFLSEESINAIINLTYFYDSMITNDTKYFQHFMLDLMPLLDIIRNLFITIKTKKKLILFNTFYQKLFKLNSGVLKQVGLWKKHVVTIMLRLENMVENSFEFCLDDQVYETTLKLIKSLVICFDKSVLMKYRMTINDTLSLISSNATKNYTLTNELIQLFKETDD